MRREFRQKYLKNFLTVLAGFIVAVAAVSAYLSSIRTGTLIVLIADVALIGVAYVSLISLEDRRISFRCGKCGKTIDIKTPWVCGSCNKPNTDIDEFPFAHRCKNCEVEPKAYKCHHDDCGKLNFLSEDEQKENFAYCFRGKTTEPHVDKHQEKIRKIREQKEEKEERGRLVETSAKLKAKKEEVKRSKPKDNRERIKESLSKTMEEHFLAEEAASQKIAEIENDPSLKDAEKQRRLDAVRNWQRGQL